MQNRNLYRRLHLMRLHPTPAPPAIPTRLRKPQAEIETAEIVLKPCRPSEVPSVSIMTPTAASRTLQARGREKIGVSHRAPIATINVAVNVSLVTNADADPPASMVISKAKDARRGIPVGRRRRGSLAKS